MSQMSKDGGVGGVNIYSVPSPFIRKGGDGGVSISWCFSVESSGMLRGS